MYKDDDGISVVVEMHLREPQVGWGMLGSSLHLRVTCGSLNGRLAVTGDCSRPARPSLALNRTVHFVCCACRVALVGFGVHVWVP